MNAWEMTRFVLFPHQQHAAAMPRHAHDGMDMPGMDNMPGMDTGATSTEPRIWGPALWALMIAMWWIMMIAMMSPSAAPTVLLYARVHRHALAQGQTQDKLAPTAVFVAATCWSGWRSRLQQRRYIGSSSATRSSRRTRWARIAAGYRPLS